MNIETTYENLAYYKRAKDYTIECEVGEGKFIKLDLCKWQVEGDHEATDSGTDFDEASQKIYDELDEEVQTEIDDYILELE